MAQGWKNDYSRYKGFFLNILSVYNTKPNLKVYLELVLSMGTIILFSIFAIKPTVLTIIDINKDIKSKEETLQKLEKKVKDLKTASILLQNESANLTLVDQGVPKQTEVEKLIPQIESIALSNNITITNISSSELALKGSIEKSKKIEDFEPLIESANELPLTITASGDYNNLLEFSKSIENLRRPIKIDMYMINASKSVDDSKVITLTIVGRFPYIMNVQEIKNEK